MMGMTFSHYRIIEKSGRGGMGEVFLAHDSFLDREVALTLLPDTFVRMAVAETSDSGSHFENPPTGHRPRL